MSTWHSGPPPHIGWWNASVSRSYEAWRWWNGVYWSAVAFPKYSAVKAAHLASQIIKESRVVKWTDYWPENARVPRIAP